MRKIESLQYKNENKEEWLPDFSPEFPYIASCCLLDRYPGRFVPWHWHREVELFYMEKGSMEYVTPGGKMVFPTGSGGLVNSNILHMTRPRKESKDTTQYLHIFDPSFLGGQQGSRIEQKYITPLVSAMQIEIIPVYPGDEEQTGLLEAVRSSFRLSREEYGYEMKLRAVLSDIWCRFLRLAKPLMQEREDHDKNDDKLKRMMIYVHEHYAEKLSVKEIAGAAYVSQRECYRAFHDCLHTTPMEYLKSYRLQQACHMLAKCNEEVTAVGYTCGMGSSSYFGKVFREKIGCSPSEYRRRWQDHNNRRQE